MEQEFSKFMLILINLYGKFLKDGELDIYELKEFKEALEAGVAAAEYKIALIEEAAEVAGGKDQSERKETA